jgi:hypothetical protein
MRPMHTPGPWHLDETEYTLFVVSDVCDIVATLAQDAVGIESVIDNARLIASAPELLEALRETLSCIDQHTEDPVVGPIIEQARQAIAKATGGAE